MMIMHDDMSWDDIVNHWIRLKDQTGNIIFKQIFSGNRCDADGGGG